MSAASRGIPRRLPPLARGREWIAAGLGAGFCLGAAEAVALHVQRVELPTLSALALLAADAATVAALSLPLALATRLSGGRVRHSTVAAGVLGPMLLAATLPHAFGLASGHPGGELPPALLLGAAAAGVGGLLAGWAGSRLERAGIPISGPPLWAAVALLVACAAVFREGGLAEPTPAVMLALGAAVLILALLAALLAVVGARRDTVVPWPWGRTLLALAFLAAGTALAPRLLPWLVMDPPGARPGTRGADVVVLALGAFGPDEGPALREPVPAGAGPVAPNLTLLAAAGTLFRHVLDPTESSSPFAWLRLPDGVAVARALRAQGYLARLAGVTEGGEGLPPGFEQGDESGGDARTASAVRATVGGTILSAFVAESAEADARAAVATRITDEARRRIAGARALDPDRPLLLVVDYRAAERNVARLDDAIGSLLDFLADLGLEEHARIVVTWTETDASGAATFRALLRPEPAAMRRLRGQVVEAPVLAMELAERVVGREPPRLDEP